jgi:hypothetical protein
MGKSKRNRNKDKRSSGAYYDDYESNRSKNKRTKNRHVINPDNSKREFNDWDSL